MYRVRLEAYDGKTGESIADLGAPVIDKCKDMESRGGGTSTVRNMDVRKDVSKIVDKDGVGGGGGGGGGAAEESASARISAVDAQPMGVDVRVSSYRQWG